MRERDNPLLAFPDVAGIANGDLDIPVARVFFGIKEQVATPNTARKTTDAQHDVDVWNTSDDRIQSLQMIRAEQDRNFTFRQAFDLRSTRFVKLADATMRDVDIAADGVWGNNILG